MKAARDNLKNSSKRKEESNMTRLAEQIAALSDEELQRLCSILDSMKQKMKGGFSYSSEIQALGYEFSFSDADMLDTDSMMALTDQEVRHRGQKLDN